jgi:hypothetical protein
MNSDDEEWFNLSDPSDQGDTDPDSESSPPNITDTHKHGNMSSKVCTPVVFGDLVGVDTTNTESKLNTNIDTIKFDTQHITKTDQCVQTQYANQKTQYVKDRSTVQLQRIIERIRFCAMDNSCTSVKFTLPIEWASEIVSYDDRYILVYCLTNFYANRLFDVDIFEVLVSTIANNLTHKKEESIWLEWMITEYPMFMSFLYKHRSRSTDVRMGSDFIWTSSAIGMCCVTQ